MKSKKLLLLIFLFVLLLSMILTLSACFKNNNDNNNNTTKKITITFYDIDGSVLTNLNCYYTKEAVGSISFPDKRISTKDDYNFYGWYYDQEFTLPAENYTTIYADTELYGKWIKAYNVTFSSNIERNTAPFNYSVKLDEGSTIKHYNSYYGYDLIGFYTDDSCEKEFNFSNPVTKATSIYAVWNLKNLTITYNNLYGTEHDNPTEITVESGEIILQEPKTNRLGYFFSCWINDSTQKEITKIEKNQGNDISISAKWVDYKVTKNANNQKVYYFGYYPQTVKANDVTVAENISENGYYLGSDNNYYAKVTSASDLSGVTYFNSNLENIHSNTIYYFKVEPIEWKCLSTSSDGTSIKLWSNTILDYQCFINKIADDSGRFLNSYLAEWLNNEFFNQAFSKDSQNKILYTTYKTDYRLRVDSFTNRIALIDVGDNSYSDLPFAKFKALGEKQSTDYSQCLGVFQNYWLRTLDSKYDSISSTKHDYAYVQIFNSTGDNYCIDSQCTYRSNGGDTIFFKSGVAPLLWLEL